MIIEELVYVTKIYSKRNIKVFFQTYSGNSYHHIVTITDKKFKILLFFFCFLSDLNEIKLIWFVKKFQEEYGRKIYDTSFEYGAIPIFLRKASQVLRKN